MAQFDIRVPLLLDERLRGLVQDVADQETGGGFNQAVRKLLEEAIKVRYDRQNLVWFQQMLYEDPDDRVDWKDLDRLARTLEIDTDARLRAYRKIERLRGRASVVALR